MNVTGAPAQSCCRKNCHKDPGNSAPCRLNPRGLCAIPHRGDRHSTTRANHRQSVLTGRPVQVNSRSPDGNRLHSAARSGPAPTPRPPFRLIEPLRSGPPPPATFCDGSVAAGNPPNRAIRTASGAWSSFPSEAPRHGIPAPPEGRHDHGQPRQEGRRREGTPVSTETWTPVSTEIRTPVSTETRTEPQFQLKSVPFRFRHRHAAGHATAVHNGVKLCTSGRLHSELIIGWPRLPRRDAARPPGRPGSGT
jgi:hypothetical protein